MYETVYAEEQITEQYADIVLQLLAKMDSVEQIATPEAMQAYVDNWLKENPSAIGGNASYISYDDTETKLGATNVQDAVGKLSEEIDGLSKGNINISNYGLTAKDRGNGIVEILFTAIASSGVTQSGNVLTIIDGITVTQNGSTLAIA